jgi:hypothetical protein
MCVLTLFYYTATRLRSFGSTSASFGLRASLGFVSLGLRAPLGFVSLGLRAPLGFVSLGLRAPRFA